MRQILITLVLLFMGAATSLTAQVENGTLVVDAGAVESLTPGKTAILVDRLVMEDASSIMLSDETPLFILWAKHVTIGNGTKIIARGRDGEIPGGDGKNGPTVILILEDVNNVRGLTIASLGGDGAKGENGRKGRKGADGSCSRASSGENGGQGSDGDRGGNAGNGGKIFLVLPQDASGYGISMITGPGIVGAGGAAGPGGDGGAGAVKCGIWPYWKHGSGRKGASGRRGHPGNEGKWGEFRTYTVGDFHETTLVDQLRDVISILNEGGYSGDADALKAVLDAGGLARN